MGLPELTFAFETAAESIVSRSKKGIVALILREAGLEPGVYTVVHEADIPPELGEDNRAYVKQALTGYLNRPARALLSVISGETAPLAGAEQLTGLDYDYLAGPPDLTEEEGAALAAYIKARRTGNFTGKAVLPNQAADHEGIINFAAGGLQVGKTVYSAGQYCARIAGILAGTPLNCSATSAKLPEVSQIVGILQPPELLGESRAVIGGGSGGGLVPAEGVLTAIHDGRQVKLGRAVNSKVTLKANESAGLKKIKVVEAIDLIHYYSIATVEDTYLGQCANTYDNKCMLLAALKAFLAQLEAGDVLAEDSAGAEIDLEATRAWLLEQGADVTSMTDEDIRRANTGSHVFIRLSGTILDAMEDFHISLSVRQ